MTRNSDTPRIKPSGRHSSQLQANLCKRGYQVALTMGNHPLIDIMAISPKGVSFKVDVKGLYKPNFWPISQKERTDKLFYVLALVPKNESNQFFVLTQDEANEGIKLDGEHTRARRAAKGLAGEPGRYPGIEPKFAGRFKDARTSLPE